MTRHIWAGIALLALAGCAQERVAQRASQGGPGPVGLPPEMPSIARTINGGLPPPDAATVRATTGVAVNRGPARGREIASAAPADAVAPANGPAPNQPGPAASTPLVAHDEPAPAAGPAVGASIPLIGTAAGGPLASPPVVESETPPAAVGSESPGALAPTPGAAGTNAPPVIDPLVSSPPSPVGNPAEPTAPAEPAGTVSAVATDPNPSPAPAPVAATAGVSPVPAAAPPVSDSVAAAPGTADAAGAPAQGGGPASIPLEMIPGSQAASPSPSAPEADRVPVRASIPLVSAPGGEVPDSVSRITAPPAQPATAERDPLLGASPDVMPNLDAAPPAADARVAPAAGPAPAPAPASVLPAATPSAGASGANDVMPALAPAALDAASQPAPLPEAAPASALAPAPAPGPVPPASASEALAPVDALAPVPAGTPVSPPSAPDPLLGANPPLMPDQAAAPGPAPAAPPPASPSTGAAAPAVGADVMPPIVLPPPSAAPAASQTPATPPAVAPPNAVPGSASNTPAPSAAREVPKADSKLVRTAADPSTVRSNMTLKAGLPSARMTQASTIAARVGDEIITRTELFAAVKERGKKHFAGQRIKLAPEEIAVLASVTLADLVDRTLVLQEAKRKLKDPKKFQMVIDAADQQFRLHEVPGLMRKYHATDERALREALTANESSLEQVRENFRREFIAGGYLGQQLNSKMKVDLPEKLAYYNAHLSDYDRPAQITWREIVVEVKKSPSRVEAHRRAEAILARLRRGEDFATVARSNSDGPTRNLGGLWQTRPGGYGVASVNNVLESAPVGQISPIVEGPSSLHIVVVEERREPGPARFDEVQDEVDRAVFEAKHRKLMDEYLDDLRSHIYVWTMFDGTANDPKALRAKHAKPAAAH